MTELKLHITVNGNAGSAIVTMPANKYNKPYTVVQQFDDGAFPGWRNLMAIWAANGHYMTDGCGNNILYSAEVGVTIDTGAAAHLQDMAYVINGRGDVSNHSANHNPEDPMGQTILLDNEVTQVLGYKPSCFIIPVNYTGFAHAASALGYRGITSEGDYFDEFNDVRHYRLIPDVPILDFDAFIRDLRDELYDPDVIAFFKSQIDLLYSGAAKFYIWATHSYIDTDALKAGIKEMYDYLHSTAQDRVLMCTLREFLEYRSMRTVPMSVANNGNIITVTFDTTNLNERTSWMDVCVNVAGAQVTGVTVDGFQSSAFNSTTGLVNGLLRKTQWGDVVTPPTPDPDQTLYIPHGRFIAQ